MVQNHEHPSNESEHPSTDINFLVLIENSVLFFHNLKKFCFDYRNVKTVTEHRHRKPMSYDTIRLVGIKCRHETHDEKSTDVQTIYTATQDEMTFLDVT